MQDEKPNPRMPRRKVVQAFVGILLISAAIWAAWFLTSPGFQDFVRNRVVARLEDATGGRVEMKAFRWNLSQMEFEADDITIHGLEKSGEPPFAHFDRIYAQAKLLSVLRREVDLRYLSVTRPSIHIIVYPDGTTNQPQPKVRSDKDPVQSLIDLAIGRLQLQQGEVVVNEQRIPIDVDASDLNLSLAFDSTAKRYAGNLHVGRGEARFKDWRPMPWHGELVFSLYRDHAEVKSFHAASGRSTLEASGIVTDLRNPTSTLTYKAHLDAREIAATTRTREVSAGIVDVQGKGAWSLRRFDAAGKLQWRGIAYRNATVRIEGLDGEASYSIEPDRIRFPRIFARLWDGTVSGKAEARRGNNGNPQAGWADLDVRGIQAAQVAKATSSPHLPFDDLHLTGVANGKVRLDWKESIQDTVAKLEIEIRPPETAPGDGSVPLTATVRGDYLSKSETFQIADLQVATPASTIIARGRLGSVSAQLNLDVRSRHIAEFRPIIDAIRGPDASQIGLDGAASFSGTINGRFRSPTIVGHLEVENFTTELPAPTAPGSGSQTIHWDSIAGELRYSPDQLSLLNGKLTRNGATVKADFTSALKDGKFGNSLPITIRSEFHDADIADLLASYGYSFPIQGKLNGSIAATGTPQNLTGTGRVLVSEALVSGEPIRTASADLQFRGSSLEFRNVHLQSPAGSASGSGSYDLKTTQFRFAASAENVQLGKVVILRGKRLDLQGVVSFEASGSGTNNAPNLNGKFRFRNLQLDGEPLGNLNLDASTSGEVMTLSARSDFAHGSVAIDGTIRLRENLPARLNAKFSDVNFDPLIRAYVKQLRVSQHTSLAGELHVEGPLREPKALTASAMIQKFSAGVENISIANQDPIRLSLRDGKVSIESLHLVGEGTDFTASGTVGAIGEHSINLRADGNVNLLVLQSLNREYTSSGLTKLSMTVRGTVEKPRLRGTIDVSNGSISYVDLPNGLSGINGTLVFTEDRLQVRKLAAHTGGGDLDLGGFIAYSNGITFNLTATGKDIRLRYPPGVSATGDANLTLAGTPKNSLLSGDVTVTRFGLSPRFDFASYLAKAKQPTPPLEPDSPLNGLRLDVRVLSTAELQVETSLAKVTGNVDLRLRGTAAKPVLLGRMNILEGDLVFNSTKYHLDRGEITFTNPARIEPVLDMEASAHVRDYDITIGFHGPGDRLSTTYRSDPPLPTADIIALLALGRTREESAQAQMYNPQNSPLDSASNELLTQALNATVSSRVQKLFGVSRIKIDPQVAGPENTSNARLTVEQTVSNKVTLTYITNLSQSAQQIIQIEYNISRDVSILAVRDQTGVLGFDVRIRQRKK